MSNSEAESFCEDLKRGCQTVWESLHEHPFVTEMAAGTLPPEKFRFYVEQNLMYLREYSRAIALGAARAYDRDELKSFTAALDNIVNTEIPQNEVLLAKVKELGAEDRGGTLAMAPANVAYTGFLLARAFSGGPLEIMTTIMPCAWSYGEIARKIAPGAVEHPVYTEWLNFFASDEYEELVTRMKAELDELASKHQVPKDDLIETFLTGARLEYGFWDMAYRMEQWPDLRQGALAGAEAGR